MEIEIKYRNVWWDMADYKEPEWKNLKNKYVRIKNIGTFYLPVEVSLIVPQLIVPFNVLVLDADDKKVKLRPEGHELELHCSILKNGVLKDDDNYFSFHKYNFLKELTKWEKLEFEVSDYVGGIYDKLGVDFDSEIKTKSKIECEYMQKSANFKLEQYLPMKGIAIFLLGMVLTSKIDFILPSDARLLLSPKIASTLLMVVFLLFIFAIYLNYTIYRRRYQELILKLEAIILTP